MILAGGAFNSPQLLMLSGIGPADHLAAHGIDVLRDRPGVGSNLQDRYEIGVVCEMKQAWKLLANATFKPPPTPNDTGDPEYVKWQNGEGIYTSNGAVLGIIKKSRPHLPDPDLFIFGLAGYFRGYYPGYSKDTERTKNFLTWAILKAHTDNRAGTCAFGRPTRGSVRRSISTTSPSVTTTATPTSRPWSRACASCARCPATISVAHEEIPGPRFSDDALRRFIRDNAWGHHASCSNPMGRRDDPCAVVDSEFRVIGTRGLRIVDASVFPRIPGFFIVTPIYMIAEKASDAILADAGAWGATP